jgi:hypothetical protein
MVKNVTVGADDPYECPEEFVLTGIRINMYDVDLNRLLDTREFRHLTIALPCD